MTKQALKINFNARSIIKSYESILYLNSANIDSSLASDFLSKVFATDGAYTRLRKKNVMPDVTIGDFDSVASKDVVCQTKLILDQNKTDFQKAIECLIQSGIKSCLICGLMGGQADHVLGNCMILCSYLSKIQLLGYHTDKNCKQLIWPMLTGKHKILTQIGQNLSIICFEPSIVSTSGLRWELNELEIRCRGPFSLRNKTIASQVCFNVVKGFVLIIQSFTD